MKRLILLLVVVFMCFAVSAQTPKKEAPKKAPAKTEQLKEHKCTDKCKNGKHVYAHGEKGHKCTDKCKKEMKKNK